MELKIKQIIPDVTLPSYAHEGDAGLDLRASGTWIINLDTVHEEVTTDTLTLHPGERVIAKTGIALELPKGTWGNIRDRSGLGRQGIHVLGGVVDENYRGEIQVVLVNLGKKPYDLTKNERIAQLIIAPYIALTIKKVKELTETKRATGGFGHTGKY
ncbi:MAG: dUTP diphosphatase [Nanoarchaeota archaeon]